jgi:hypothetical protein
MGLGRLKDRRDFNQYLVKGDIKTYKPGWLSGFFLFFSSFQIIQD